MTKKFLVIGNRGGYYHIRSQKDTLSEAKATAKLCAGYKGSVQMTYLVAEVHEAYKSPAPYTRHLPRCREGFSSPDKTCMRPAGHKGPHKFD